MKILEDEMKLQINKSVGILAQPEDRGIGHKRAILFKQLRPLRWPDLFTLLGLLCVASSVYYSFKGVFAVAYGLLLAQYIFDFVDGKLARTIGGGVLGTYLDSFSDFLSVAAAIVFGWFVGIDGFAMYLAGFLNLVAAAIRLSYFTVIPQTGFTGIPTVLAAVTVSTIAYLGYYFFNANIEWFVVFYFAAAVAMISDLRVRKIASYFGG